MRVFSVFAAALCLPSVSAAVCTEAELKVYDPVRDAAPPYCVSVIARFHLCQDECYLAMQNNAKLAPNCTEVGNSDGSLLEFADAWVIRCEQERALANSTAKYVPRPTLDAPVCTREQVQRWSETYDLQTTPAGKCRSGAVIDNKCSDECLETVEEAVEASPVCRTSSSGNFTMREYSKGKLADCLVARKVDLEINAVLQSRINAFDVGEPTNDLKTNMTEDIQSPNPATTTPTAASSARRLVLPVLTAIWVAMIVRLAL